MGSALFVVGLFIVRIMSLMKFLLIKHLSENKLVLLKIRTFIRLISQFGK